MLKVFPCYSTPDREIVHSLAAFLERGAGVEILLEEGEMPPGGDLIAKAEEGLSADVVLVLLSPEAVPPRWVLERWKSVFWEQAAEVGTAFATLLCRDAKFPDLLRRKNFFDLRQNRLAAFRAIKRWLMGLSPLPREASFVPARQPSFQGRDAELETLCALLADTPGMAVLEAAAGAGKTRIFIHPPYDFRIADALLTNFHLPRSTLLMLVSAFAMPNDTRGRELILSTYATAIRERYRFFSYGDAMLITQDFT